MECDPWTDLRGEEHLGVRGKTMSAFRDVMTLFLKTVFSNNAGEDMKFYMTCLKKPNRVKVRPFLARVAKLQSYVGKLPCLFDSRDATEATKRVVPHNDGEFATNMLHAMPKVWKQQYYLGHKAPVNIQYLQDALEKIEVAFPVDGSSNHKNYGKVSSSNNKSTSSNKMTSPSGRIPKNKK